MKKLFYLSFLFIFFGMFSCKKEKDFTNNKNELISITNSSTNGKINKSIENYNFIGIIHNNLLDSVGYSGFFPFESTTNLFHFIKNHLEKIYGDSTTLTYLDFNNLSNIEIDTNSLLLIGEGYLSQEKISSFSYLELVKLDSILKFSTHETIEANIFDFIENIEINDNFSILEKELIINSSIIGLYSFEYWTNAFNSSTNPWYIQYGVNNDNLEDRFACRLLADVVGYIRGWLEGGDEPEGRRYWAIAVSNTMSAMH